MNMIQKWKVLERREFLNYKMEQTRLEKKRLHWKTYPCYVFLTIRSRTLFCPMSSRAQGWISIQMYVCPSTLLFFHPSFRSPHGLKSLSGLSNRSSVNSPLCFKGHLSFWCYCPALSPLPWNRNRVGQRASQTNGQRPFAGMFDNAVPFIPHWIFTSFITCKTKNYFSVIKNLSILIAMNHDMHLEQSGAEWS